MIIGSYVFWAGTQFSDETCDRLSVLPSTFKCAQVISLNSNLWLKCTKIRSTSHDCAADPGLEACPFSAIREYRAASSPRSFQTGRTIFHNDANLCCTPSPVYISRLPRYNFPSPIVRSFQAANSTYTHRYSGLQFSTAARVRECTSA